MSTYGYLAHHGIKGQKWGVRRYENPDGSLTEAGKKRYGYKTENAKTNAGKESVHDGNKIKKQSTVKESPYKVKGASQSIKNFSVSKAASDCAKMIDKFNAELDQPNDKYYSGEDVQMFLEKNLKEFWDLWKNDENTVFDLEEKIAEELDKKGYKYID